MSADASVPAKKREILKLAFDKFYDGGFHATGIDAVMAESGISKRTLYKYFASKEELIEAVLDQYGRIFADTFFAPVFAASDDGREQIMACFDVRRMLHERDRRGCLGIKASQEYVGRHEGIAERGKAMGHYIEQRFIDMCGRGSFAEPELLGRQIAILFQGAVLLSQVYGHPEPFVSAKAAVETLLDQAEARAKKAVVT